MERCSKALSRLLQDMAGRRVSSPLVLPTMSRPGPRKLAAPHTISRPGRFRVQHATPLKKLKVQKVATALTGAHRTCTTCHCRSLSLQVDGTNASAGDSVFAVRGLQRFPSGDRPYTGCSINAP